MRRLVCSSLSGVLFILALVLFIGLLGALSRLVAIPPLSSCVVDMVKVYLAARRPYRLSPLLRAAAVQTIVLLVSMHTKRALFD